MSPTPSRKVWEKAWLALLLAFAGGSVDAIGYMVLLHLFTAHMSGNSIAMGVHISEHRWGEAFRRGFPIPMFVLGVLAGALLNEALFRRGVRQTFSVVLACEALLLILFWTFGAPLLHDSELAMEPAWRFYLLTALPAVAVGLQNATLRRVGGETVRTTYITGVLTDFSEEVAKCCYWFGDAWNGPQRRLRELLGAARQDPCFGRSLLLLGIWTAYAAGAILSALVKLRWQLLALAIPIGCLAIVILCDFLSPISEPLENRGG